MILGKTIFAVPASSKGQGLDAGSTARCIVKSSIFVIGCEGLARFGWKENRSRVLEKFKKGPEFRQRMPELCRNISHDREKLLPAERLGGRDLWKK